MLILDEGFWNGHSCLARGGWMFSGTFVVLFILLLYHLFRLKRLASPARQRSLFPAIATYSLLGLLLIFALSGATVLALARERTLLFVENGSLVAQGYQRLAAYEDRFDLAAISMEYAYHKGHGRGRESHWAVFQSHDGRKSVTVSLRRTNHLRELARIAPGVIRDYVAKLKERGRRIPGALADFR